MQDILRMLDLDHPMAFLSNGATCNASSGCGCGGWGSALGAGWAGSFSMTPLEWSWAAGVGGGGVGSFNFSGWIFGTCVSLLAGVATGASAASVVETWINEKWNINFGGGVNGSTETWETMVCTSALFPSTLLLAISSSLASDRGSLS